MMTVVLNRPDECLDSAQNYFDFVYENEWSEDTRVRHMIKDIDNVDLVNPIAGFSPVLGSVSIRDLSGGVKGLILILKGDEYRAFSSCIFGDNCAEWICKLSLEVDFTFYWEHGFAFCAGEALGAPYVLDREVLAITPDGNISRTSEGLSRRLNLLGGGIK